MVTAHDGSHRPLAGAALSVQWSTGANAVEVSDASGKSTFTVSGLSLTTPSVSLTVTGATHPPLSYDAGANHDPDGDSTGTSITVLRP